MLSIIALEKSQAQDKARRLALDAVNAAVLQGYCEEVARLRADLRAALKRTDVKYMKGVGIGFCAGALLVTLLYVVSW